MGQLSLRTIATQIGSNRSFIRRLPGDLGGARYPASTEGGLKHLKWDVNSIDPDLTRFAKRYVRRGNSIWDVGANVGLFAFAAAGLAGPSGSVLAIEPDPLLAGRLQAAAVLRDKRAPVTVLAAAVSDETGLAVFEIAESSRAMNHLAGFGAPQSLEKGARSRQPVPTLTLDSLLDELRPPDVMKIDVEGAEALVLRGAQRLLREYRPIIMLEVAETSADDVGQLLTAVGYRMVDWETGAPVDRPTWSTLALPSTVRNRKPDDAADRVLG